MKTWIIVFAFLPVFSNAQDPCEPSPCANFAQCISDNTFLDGFHCKCFEIYKGLLCQSLVAPNPCLSNPCQNGGACSPGFFNIQFTCQCLDAFEGPLCQIAVNQSNPCDPSPCLNGGLCETDPSNGPGGFRCVCTEGFEGPTCFPSELDLCPLQPCLNGGKCTFNPFTLSSTCDCMEGFDGPICNVLSGAHPCSSQPCFNGGTCISNSSESFSCQCTSLFRGPTCSSPVLFRERLCQDMPVAISCPLDKFISIVDVYNERFEDCNTSCLNPFDINFPLQLGQLGSNRVANLTSAIIRQCPQQRFCSLVADRRMIGNSCLNNDRNSVSVIYQCKSMQDSIHETTAKPFETTVYKIKPSEEDGNSTSTPTLRISSTSIILAAILGVTAVVVIVTIASVICYRKKRNAKKNQNTELRVIPTTTEALYDEPEHGVNNIILPESQGYVYPARNTSSSEGLYIEIDGYQNAGAMKSDQNYENVNSQTVAEKSNYVYESI